MNLLKIYLSFILILFFVSSTSAQYTITRGVFGNGRGNLSGDNQNVRGTVGQTLIGKTENTTFQSRIGFWYTIDWIVSDIATPEELLPLKFELFQNYPNPFNPVTVIHYSLPVTCEVDLSIYNILGQKVATLVNKQQNAGSYKVNFDASNLSSGIYVYSLHGGGIDISKKMILMK